MGTIDTSHYFTPSAPLYADVDDQTITGGARVTVHDLGTVASGTTTLDSGDGPLQKMINGGASTIAAPANDGSLALMVTNNASAGAITFSGFQVGTNYGDDLTTTNGDDFIIHVVVANSIAAYTIQDLQN